MSAATVKLSELRLVIRQGWDKDAYSQGRDMAENADENDHFARGSVQVEVADEGIRSSFSGGYLEMTLFYGVDYTRVEQLV